MLHPTGHLFSCNRNFTSPFQESRTTSATIVKIALIAAGIFATFSTAFPLNLLAGFLTGFFCFSGIVSLFSNPRANNHRTYQRTYNSGGFSSQILPWLFLNNLSNQTSDRRSYGSGWVQNGPRTSVGHSHIPTQSRARGFNQAPQVGARHQVGVSRSYERQRNTPPVIVHTRSPQQGQRVPVGANTSVSQPGPRGFHVQTWQRYPGT